MVTKNTCPECGSQDNLILFENGSEWCFTPGCDHNKNKNAISLSVAALPKRGLTLETCAKYGVGTHNDPKVLLLPYYKDGHVVAYQARTPDKKFWFIGDAKKATLFGLQATQGNRRLIITEGALDALAAHQMTGYDAVAIRSASTALNDVKANLEYIESFEHVYVCTDMDPQGRKAAQEIMSLLRPGKGLLMNLPTGFKDPCDMLVDQKVKEFKSCLFASKPINVEGVLDDDLLVSKAVELFTNETKRRGVSSGSENLDYLLGGLRPGEVTLVVGGTGVGKTAVVRQLAINLAAQSQKVFFVPLEMGAEVVLLQLAEMLLQGNVFTDPEFTESTVSDSLKELTSNIKFFDHFGTMDPIKLLNTIEYVCRVHDIKFVILDHLSAVVNGGEDERRDVDKTIAGLKELSLRLGLHIIVVSHISRSRDDKDDNDPTLSRVRHSAGIAQYSDQVLGVVRDRKENRTKITTLKVSRLWGKYGSCYWEWEQYHFVDAEKKGGQNEIHDGRLTRDTDLFDAPDHTVDANTIKEDCDDTNLLCNAVEHTGISAVDNLIGIEVGDGLLTVNVDDVEFGVEGEPDANTDDGVLLPVDMSRRDTGSGVGGITSDTEHSFSDGYYSDSEHCLPSLPVAKVLIKDGAWISTW